MTSPGYIVLDFETRSPVDLKKTNVYIYASDKDTQPICLSYLIVHPGEVRPCPIKTWINSRVIDNIADLMTYNDSDLKDSILRGFVVPRDLEDAIKAGYQVWAHNCEFEREIWGKIMVARLGWPSIKGKQWRDTQACGAIMSYPQSMGGLADALRLPVEKDKTGHRVMLKLCKPRKPRKKEVEDGVAGRLWHEDTKDFYTLIKYCEKDVEVEHQIKKALPELNDYEYQIWRLDQRINARGFHVNTKAAQAFIDKLEDMKAKAIAELPGLTGGRVTTAGQIARIEKFCGFMDVKLKNTRAETVDEILNMEGFEEKHPEVFRVLQIRRQFGRSATAKFQSMIDKAHPDDDRVRGHLVYCGAGRTRRWTGRGVQPQNMARGDIKSVSEREWCIDRIVAGDSEAVDLVHGLTSAMSSCVRPMVCAPPGHDLICADFASIEARVIFWLIGDHKTTELLRSGGSLYKDLGGEIFGVDPLSIDKGTHEYHVGKTGALACQYGMGPDTLSSQSGLDLELSDRIIQAYRRKYRLVPQFWRKCERAAIQAIQNESVVRVNDKVRYEKKGRYLFCYLPSGQRITYVEPRLEEDINKKGRQVIKMSAMSFVKGQWVRRGFWGGPLTGHIIQSTSRDLLAPGMIKVERKGYFIIFSVHDEIIAEVPAGFGSLEEFIAYMCEGQPWAAGCPIAAEGWRGKVYRK